MRVRSLMRGEEDEEKKPKMKSIHTLLPSFPPLFLSTVFLPRLFLALAISAMIRARCLPSAGGPRIGGSSRRDDNSSDRGGIASQRSIPTPTATATKTRATSTQYGDSGSGREKKKKTAVIGLGSCGLDYLAVVAAFPKPDDKLRTEKMEVRMLFSS